MLYYLHLPYLFFKQSTTKILLTDGKKLIIIIITERNKLMILSSFWLNISDFRRFRCANLEFINLSHGFWAPSDLSIVYSIIRMICVSLLDLPLGPLILSGITGAELCLTSA